MILYKNIFFMLCYTFSSLKFSDYKNYNVAQFNKPEDVLAEALIISFSSALKRGIYKEYIEKEETLNVVRGKININKTIEPKTILNKKVVCEHDDFSIDNTINQIIKLSIIRLLKSDVKKERKEKLKNLEFYLNDVTLKNVRDIKWNFTYNNLNSYYKFIILVCWLILNKCILTEDEAKIKALSFLDKNEMSYIYEHFIYNYYEREHKDKVRLVNKTIPWDIKNDESDFLPKMLGDIILESKTTNKVLIIDAKYYTHNLQEKFNKSTIRSAHIYQIFSYSVNFKATNNDMDVTGMLLYARTDNTIQPETNGMLINNVQICSSTLDLLSSIEEIKEQLDTILNVYL